MPRFFDCAADNWYFIVDSAQAVRYSPSLPSCLPHNRNSMADGSSRHRAVRRHWLVAAPPVRPVANGRGLAGHTFCPITCRRWPRGGIALSVGMVCEARTHAGAHRSRSPPYPLPFAPNYRCRSFVRHEASRLIAHDASQSVIGWHFLVGIVSERPCRVDLQATREEGVS